MNSGSTFTLHYSLVFIVLVTVMPIPSTAQLPQSQQLVLSNVDLPRESLQPEGLELVLTFNQGKVTGFYDLYRPFPPLQRTSVHGVRNGDVLTLFSDDERGRTEITGTLKSGKFTGVVKFVNPDGGGVEKRVKLRSRKSPWSKYPPVGHLPDEASAVMAAEELFIRIYGRSVLSERPFKATIDDNVWIVTGTLHCSPECVGGTVAAHITRQDGRVITVFHTK